MVTILRDFWRQEDAQTLIEYVLLLALMAVAALATLGVVGQRLSTRYHATNSLLP
ncbi:MAG: Flp family type IVb pilin [Armatimonadetes bacterium]|nr:Flp family type IVb pilin [Armatimonadota bacterium]